MRPTGIIFAALDCDAEVIEDWNRWYDLEHTPPNVLLEGVMSSNRYVAPPACHAARLVRDGAPFAGGRATFITVYTLTGDPGAAFDGMSGLREQLIEQGRMAFPDDRKAVRQGDVLAGVAAVAASPTRCVPDDVPFLGHTGVIVCERTGDLAAGAARAGALVDRPGVHGVWTLESRLRPGVAMDLVFVEGDVAAMATTLRAEVPFAAGVDVTVDAPYERIVPLHYPWAASIRDSDLPATVA
jgi:hypothetical protein